MPIVSLWVMPAGLMGVLTMAFGFDAWFWRLTGEGIQWMNTVALWVTGLPGAVGRIRAFGIGPLLLGTAGLLLLCLLRTPLRWSGVVAVMLASFWALATPPPDVFIASDGRAVAARGSDGYLAMLKGGSDSFAIREWLAADADARKPGDGSLAEATMCDRTGCVTRLPDGRFVALAMSPEAYADDCRRAAIVVMPGNAPAGCAATVIDRRSRQQTGAVTIRPEAGGFAVTATRPPGYDRPWARAVPLPSTASTGSHNARPAAAPDATPRLDDLEAGD